MFAPFGRKGGLSGVHSLVAIIVVSPVCPQWLPPVLTQIPSFIEGTEEANAIIATSFLLLLTGARQQPFTVTGFTGEN